MSRHRHATFHDAGMIDTASQNNPRPQSASVAWPAAAAHAVTCSDHNFNDVPAVNHRVSSYHQRQLEFIYYIYIYYIYIYVLLYIIIYYINSEVQDFYLLFQT